MGVCEVCGNDYDKTMQVIVGGETHVFDSFECAIHARCGLAGSRLVVLSASGFVLDADIAHERVAESLDLMW